MTVVSSKEFATNQDKYFELALSERVFIKAEFIKHSPRQGWAEAAKQMAQEGDDELLIPDFFEDEDLSWWTWDEEEK